MPHAINSPAADAVETILDAHTLTGTFEARHPARSGHDCACGTKHPFDGGGPFPSHVEHLAALISAHLATEFDTLPPAAIVRVMDRHSIARSFTKPLPHREVDECRCGTQHPPTFDGRFATHRRHLAEQIAALLTAPQPQRVPASR